MPFASLANLFPAIKVGSSKWMKLRERIVSKSHGMAREQFFSDWNMCCYAAFVIMPAGP